MLHLNGNDLSGDIGFPLFQCLAYAQNHLQPAVESGTHPLGDRFIGLAKILPALAVTDDDILHTQLLEHRCGDFSGKGSALCPVAVLGADLYIGSLGQCQRCLQIGVRRAQHDLTIRVLYQRQQFGDECLCLGTVFVHFPVAGDDRTAFCFVHIGSSSLG